jgi:competence protein ComEC
MGSCPRLVALALAVTLGAQIAVAPVLVGTFGELSVVAPLANLLAAPAVAPATVLGLGAATTGAIWPAAGSMFARLAEPFVAWILGVGRTTGGWSWASLQVPKWWGWPLGALVVGAALARMRSIPAVTEKGPVEAAK